MYVKAYSNRCPDVDMRGTNLARLVQRAFDEDKLDQDLPNHFYIKRGKKRVWVCTGSFDVMTTFSWRFAPCIGKKTRVLIRDVGVIHEE